MYCERCGKTISDTATYCKYCGTKMTKKETEGSRNHYKELFIVLALFIQGRRTGDNDSVFKGKSERNRGTDNGEGNGYNAS